MRRSDAIKRVFAHNLSLQNEMIAESRRAKTLSEYVDPKTVTAYELLICSFVWNKTVKGIGYWNKITSRYK